jgi:hypothetical protein
MKKCLECPKEFEPINPKGLFCSAACRQKNYRKKVAEKLRYWEKMNSKQPLTSEVIKEVAKRMGKEAVSVVSDKTVEMPSDEEISKMGWKEKLELRKKLKLNK